MLHFQIHQRSQLQKIVQKILHHIVTVADFFPVIFFFGGFAWDAYTVGRHVAVQDLFVFTAYLMTAGLILYMIGRPSYALVDDSKLPKWIYNVYTRMNWHRFHWEGIPYFLLQFIFGNLLSALFILYFKSASHGLAWLMVAMLGILLVANEYLENEYRRFTLSWALFGLCTMLLFNFVLPFLLGSIHPAWFYISTLLGLGSTYWLYKNTPNHLGSIIPVWLIAITLMLAYRADIIPPVPLVKRNIAVAYAVEKINGKYTLTQQASRPLVFWRKTSNHLVVVPGQRVYCISSIFAPSGLHTKLYHRWQFYDSKLGWQTKSRPDFTLAGGREHGYRWFSYYEGLKTGDWRVGIETENHQTLAVFDFSVEVVKDKASSISNSTITRFFD